MGDVDSGRRTTAEHQLGPHHVGDHIVHGPSGEAAVHVPLTVAQPRQQRRDGDEFGGQQVDGPVLVDERRHRATVAAAGEPERPVGSADNRGGLVAGRPIGPLPAILRSIGPALEPIQEDRGVRDGIRSMRQHAWKYWMISGVVAIGGYFALPGTTSQNVGKLAIGMGSVAGILRGTVLNRPADRMGWYLLAAGMASFSAGEAVQNTYHLILHRALP